MKMTFVQMFEALVETPASAVFHSRELTELFNDGLDLERSEQLTDLRRRIYDSAESGNSDAD